MKEMKRQFYLRRDEMAQMLVTEAGFFLFGEIMLGIMVFVTGDRESVIPVGTITALMGSAFFLNIS